MNFRKRINKGNGVESVTNPYHRETVRELRNQMWSAGALELDALVKVIDGFSEPQANDQE